MVNSYAQNNKLSPPFPVAKPGQYLYVFCIINDSLLLPAFLPTLHLYTLTVVISRLKIRLEVIHSLLRLASIFFYNLRGPSLQSSFFLSVSPGLFGRVLYWTTRSFRQRKGLFFLRALMRPWTTTTPLDKNTKKNKMKL
jgi:hypothetical protein